MTAVFRSIALVTLLFIAFAISSSAQEKRVESYDLWLNRLIGNWVLKGEIAGKSTTHHVKGEWVLNRLYVRLHEVSVEKTPSGRPAYEAIVYVTRDVAPGGYAVLWLDNTASGAFAPEGTGHATPDGNSLPFVFRDSQGDISFKNTFVYDAGKKNWAWVMDNVSKGVSKPFGRVKLTKRQ